MVKSNATLHLTFSSVPMGLAAAVRVADMVAKVAASALPSAVLMVLGKAARPRVISAGVEAGVSIGFA